MKILNVLEGINIYIHLNRMLKKLLIIIEKTKYLWLITLKNNNFYLDLLFNFLFIFY